MSIKSQFLTLSMREQICLTIIFLSLFSILVIICIIGPLVYEILKQDYNQKKIFIYDRYKEFIESSFFFQNFNLLQYEEIMKRIQKQIWAFYEMADFYNISLNYKNQFLFEKVINFDSEKYEDLIKNKNDDDLLYFLFYMPLDSEEEAFFYEIYNFFELLYEPLSSLLISHNIESVFRLPGFDVPITTAPLFVGISSFIMFSFNYTTIYNNLINNFGSLSNYDNNRNSDILANYFQNKISETMNTIYKMLDRFENGELFMFTYQFRNAINEITESNDISSFSDRDNLVKINCGHYSSLDYFNDHFSLIVYANEKFYYTEMAIIDNYLFYMNNKMLKYLNISFIPLYPENNTIISPELCLSFILKQLDYQIDENEIDELFKKIKKGESTIKDCFIKENLKIIDKQFEIKDMLNSNFSFFLGVSNLIEQGLMLNDKKSYYFAKYTYPNYDSLIDFKTDYLFLDQINYYLFASFKEPIEYTDEIFNNNRNLFYLIIIITLYIWMLSLFINLIIFSKEIIKLTNPIKILQEAIESSSIKDEDIFNYEYDEFINDLFLTSKELLTGQIDNKNNDQSLGEFNILSLPDDIKNVDKNLYQRNLIINNDIMNQLIMEQQIMLDFSKNIKINEELELYLKKDKYNENDNDNDNDEDILKYNIKNNNFKSTKFEQKMNIEEKKNRKIYENKQNKSKEEEEDREPYKKLFKIAEYLYYHQNKVENNYINIVNNEIRDESKRSKISKISSNININGSLKKNKLKRSIIRTDVSGKTDEGEKISINMINNTNITYLWYMEAKKKNNQSINYKINKNYNELFMDDIIYQNHYESIEKHDSIKGIPSYKKI